ncbi:MAG: hypothetical protein H7245_11820 [Candidatus Saccharibacteria bacterium]|nr:hypothetical protein [Pseudorhodobacter sp.]
MTFKQFLSMQKAGHDERGDFLRLANADVHVPDTGTWPEFYAYFETRHGGRMADSGSVLWKEYQAGERKARNVLKS